MPLKGFQYGMVLGRSIEPSVPELAVYTGNTMVQNATVVDATVLTNYNSTVHVCTSLHVGTRCATDIRGLQ